MAVNMKDYKNTTIVKMDKAKPHNWGGNTSEIGVGHYPHPAIDSRNSAYIVLVDDSGSHKYMTPEAALELAFGLFDLVEKTKPSIIQSNGSKD